MTCLGGQTNCSGTCTSLQTDSKNCGKCGSACAAGKSCCGAKCVDLLTDSNNCGKCGAACSNNKKCKAGTCSCPALGKHWKKGTSGWAHLRQDTGLFSKTDCPNNWLSSTMATYGSVPFLTGPKPSGKVTGLSHLGVTLASPDGETFITSVHSIAGGGRCKATLHKLTFTYTDGSSSLAQVTVPHDCSCAAASGTNAKTVCIGNSPGPCCTGFQQQTFTNPSPTKAVSSLTYLYHDGCNGSYLGQVYALTAKVAATSWSCW